MRERPLLSSLSTALIVLVASLPATASAAQPTLTKIGESGPVAVYVDKETIRRSGSTVRASLEWRWSRATELPDNPNRTYRLERQVQVCNCDNKSYAIAEATLYADDRGTEPVGGGKYDETALAFSVAPPRTIRDTVVTYVCSAAPAKK